MNVKGDKLNVMNEKLMEFNPKELKGSHKEEFMLRKYLLHLIGVCEEDKKKSQKLILGLLHSLTMKLDTTNEFMKSVCEENMDNLEEREYEEGNDTNDWTDLEYNNNREKGLYDGELDVMRQLVKELYRKSSPHSMYHKTFCNHHSLSDCEYDDIENRISNEPSDLLELREERSRKDLINKLKQTTEEVK